MTASGQPERRAGDAGELREEIERTREQLGETVAQLAAKADVKARVRAKVTGLTGQAKSLTARAASQAEAQATQARRQLAARVTQRPELLVLAAVAMATGFLALRRWRKR